MKSSPYPIMKVLINDNKEYKVYIYQNIREDENTKVLVVTNMRGNVEHITLPFEIKKTLLSNYKKGNYNGKVQIMSRVIFTL